MANLQSSRKRIRQNEKCRARNRSRKAALKTTIRQFDKLVHDGDVAKGQEMLAALTKQIDQTAAKGTIHPNTAARRKSRVARALNALKAKAAK